MVLRCYHFDYFVILFIFIYMYIYSILPLLKICRLPSVTSISQSFTLMLAQSNVIKKYLTITYFDVNYSYKLINSLFSFLLHLLNPMLFNPSIYLILF